MLDFLYQNPWGAFSVMLFFQIPFLIVFFVILHRGSSGAHEPGATDSKKLGRLDGIWMALVIVLFLGFNYFSIRYMPPVSSAQAAVSQQNILDVEVTAESWSYEMSAREFEVGRPVRFAVKSKDTMHSFAIYHPDGRMLFTMMLMPGLETPATIIHTFTEPGTYKVRCLEYCGAAHHDMSDEIVIRPSS